MVNNIDSDEVLSLIGLGRWQIGQCIWLFLFYLAWSSVTVSIVLIGFVPDFTCSSPHTSSENVTDIDVSFDNLCSAYNSSTNTSSPCQSGYLYAEPKHMSIVSEWDLVCGQEFLSEFSQSAMTIGLGIGALIFPPLADRFGRKYFIIWNHAAFVVVSAATAFVPNIWVFTAARLLIGALLSGTGMIAWVYTLEMFVPKHRTSAALISNFVWAVGVCALPLLGYLMDGRSWRHLQLTFSIFSIALIGQFLTLDESIRWLLANRRRQEAFQIVRHAARLNKVDVDLVNAHLARLISEETKTANCINTNKENDTDITKAMLNGGVSHKTNASFLQIARHPTLLKITAILSLAWFANSLTYYGIYMLSSTMSGSRYLNLFLNSVVEIPSSLLLIPITFRFGRRKTCIGFYSTAGLSLIAAAILNVTTGGHIGGILQTCVVVFGKFCVSATFMNIFMYTPELYPTNIRSIGLGLADISCRIGGFIAPFAVTVARAVPWVPVCVFGGLCLLVSAFSFFLPETGNRELPQTIDDIDITFTGPPDKTTGDQEMKPFN